MTALVLDFLKSSAVPALGVAVFFFLIGGRSDPFRARLQSLALAIGFVIGNYVINGHLNIPPHDVNEAFSWAALALVAFVWISPRPVGSRYALRALFVLGLGALCLWQIRDSLHGQVHVRNLLAFFCLALGAWSILEKASQKVQPLSLLVLPLITASALAVLLMIKGSAALAQQLGVLCTVLGALLAIVLVRPKRVSAAAILPFVSIFIILFMVAGHFYLDINPWILIYLCAPYLLLWIRGGIPFVPRTPIGEALTLGAISAAPVAYFTWEVYKSSGPLF